MKDDAVKSKPVAERKGISRRTVVKTAGAAGVAAATGVGLFGGTPPAFAQKRTIHYLMDSYFISGAKDVHLAVNEEFKKQTGVEIKMEFINQNDLNTRLTAAVEAGAGPDMTILKWNMPHLFAGGMANHDALMADIDASDYYGFMNDATIVDGVYRAMPTYMTPNAWVYRTDIFEELGISPFPETMDDYLVAGKKLKDNGTPIGFTLGHTLGDAPANCYTWLWAFGGREVDENQKVMIDSAETRAAMEFFRGFWNDACDPGGLSYDDGSNNRAMLAGRIACTCNAASIYYFASNNPDKVPEGLADNLHHAPLPAGPGGSYGTNQPLSQGIFEHSTQKEACMEYLKFFMTGENFEKWFVAMGGQAVGPSPAWEDHAFWQTQPALGSIPKMGKYGRSFGFSGPYDRKASEVQAKYIIIDLLALVARGDSVDDTVKWAETELKQIYEG